MSLTRKIIKKPKRRWPAKYATRTVMACTDIDLKLQSKIRFLAENAAKVLERNCRAIAAVSPAGMNNKLK